MSESLFQSIGSVSFPLAASEETGFTERDPARTILLELLAAAITAELEGVWEDAVADTPLIGSLPVQMKLPEIPDATVMSQVKTTFPLLTVCRNDSPVGVEEFAIHQVKETWRWDVDYILGPLEVGNARLVGDVLLLVARVMLLTIRNAGHLAYATQTSQGFTYPKNVLAAGEGCCNFSSARVVEYRLGSGGFAPDGPKYHACSLTLETTELSNLVEGGAPPLGSFKGSSITLQTGTEQGLKTIVVADTAVIT